MAAGTSATVTESFERQVCKDWQAGIMRWTDAVASLRLAGLPQLYVLAYRLGVPVRRRFADEALLPVIRGYDLTSPVWRAHPAWQAYWHDGFERDAGTITGYGSGPGHAQRRSEGLERGVWWLMREQHCWNFVKREADRMERDEAADREKLARLILKKGLDRTLEHPEVTPRDFVAAWLDGDLPIAELGSRMQLSPAQVERLRTAATQAAFKAHRRILAHRELWAAMMFGWTAEERVELVIQTWAAGRTSTKMAQEIVGTDEAGLRRLASEFDIEITRDDA